MKKAWSMKKYLFLIFLTALFACEEDDLVRYAQEKDSLQFAEDNDDLAHFNFADATYRDEDGHVCYYGDSLKVKRFESVIVDLQGFPAPDERPYKLKAVLLEGQDPATQAEVVFEPYYSLAPNALKDTISLSVVRPPKRGTYRVGITLDTEGPDAFFEKGTYEHAVLEFEIKDTYEEPADWKFRTDWLGEFDEEKYAFMVSVTQQPFSRTGGLWQEIDQWENTDRFNVAIREALAEFNRNARPEDRKQFAFPETTKPIWWDRQLKYLGEFSEEKHAFAKKVYGGELKEEAALEYWNLKFRDAAKEEGIADFSFPELKGQAVWWRSSALGDFSVEKQEFVIRTFFEITSNYSITEETWTYANVMLRYALQEYQAGHPETSLGFAFPVEGKPEWWGVREKFLGDYSDVKRDLAVVAVFQTNAQWGEFNINALLDAGLPFDEGLARIKEAARQYNEQHPDADPIVIPEVAPEWWKGEKIAQLGEWSPAKEKFMQEVMDQYGGTYGEWTNYVDWNPIFRYEWSSRHAVRPDELSEVTFPEIDARPDYWDELPYLGAYSESKQVFVWMVLLPVNFGNVDGWYLGAPSAYGDKSVWPERHKRLTDAYAQGYDEFMRKYAAANPEAFIFPASYE